MLVIQRLVMMLIERVISSEIHLVKLPNTLNKIDQ